MIDALVQLAYVVATALFVFALHWMNAPGTARRGVYAGVIGMALAVAATWARPEVVHHLWIVIAVVLAFAVGIPLSRVPLTAVPQRTALSHAFGGLAAGLVGTAKFYLWYGEGSAATPLPYAERAALDASTPIVPGEQETTATVSVTFSLR